MRCSTRSSRARRCVRALRGGGQGREPRAADRLAYLEANVKAALDGLLIAQISGGGAWNHGELGVEALQEASAVLRSSSA